jgi:hypothetical protein
VQKGSKYYILVASLGLLACGVSQASYKFTSSTNDIYIDTLAFIFDSPSCGYFVILVCNSYLIRINRGLFLIFIKNHVNDSDWIYAIYIFCYKIL